MKIDTLSGFLIITYIGWVIWCFIFKLLNRIGELLNIFYESRMYIRKRKRFIKILEARKQVLISQRLEFQRVKKELRKMKENLDLSLKTINSDTI